MFAFYRYRAPFLHQLFSLPVHPFIIYPENPTIFHVLYPNNKQDAALGEMLRAETAKTKQLQRTRRGKRGAEVGGGVGEICDG